MIQRLQSIYLLFAAGFFGGEFFSSLAKSDKVVQGIFSDQMYNLYDQPVLLVLCSLGIILSLVNIFLYRNRPLQLKMTYGITTIAILIPLIAILIFVNPEVQVDNAKISDDIGLYLPIGVIVFSILAIKNIKKDENLIKSMDRLR